MGRVELVGAARREPVSGVAHLRPEDPTVEAMLRGWSAQQVARGLHVDTIEPRVRLVQRFMSHASRSRRRQTLPQPAPGRPSQHLQAVQRAWSMASRAQNVRNESLLAPGPTTALFMGVPTRPSRPRRRQLIPDLGTADSITAGLIGVGPTDARARQGTPRPLARLGAGCAWRRRRSRRPRPPQRRQA